MSFPKLSPIFEEVERDGKETTFSEAAKRPKEKGKSRFATFKGIQKAFVATQPKAAKSSKEGSKPNLAQWWSHSQKTQQPKT